MLQWFLGFVGRIVERVPTQVRRLVQGWYASWAATRAQREAGMSTAEYAVGTIAACAFAALLYKVVTSSQILDLLSGLVSRALQVPF